MVSVARKVVRRCLFPEDEGGCGGWAAHRQTTCYSKINTSQRYVLCWITDVCDRLRICLTYSILTPYSDYGSVNVDVGSLKSTSPTHPFSKRPLNGCAIYHKIHFLLLCSCDLLGLFNPAGPRCRRTRCTVC
jgi:hypothetical protein